MYQHLHYRDVRKRREKGIENVLGEIMAENCPNLKKETDIQVQEAQSSEKDKPKETHTK